MKVYYVQYGKKVRNELAKKADGIRKKWHAQRHLHWLRCQSYVTHFDIEEGQEQSWLTHDTKLPDHTLADRLNEEHEFGIQGCFVISLRGCPSSSATHYFASTFSTVFLILSIHRLFVLWKACQTSRNSIRSDETIPSLEGTPMRLRLS